MVLDKGQKTKKEPIAIRPVIIKHKDEKQKVLRGTTLLQQDIVLHSLPLTLVIRPSLFIRISPSVQPGSSGVIFKQTYASCLSADEQLSLIAQSLLYSSPSSL
jgi:hypothetical protein